MYGAIIGDIVGSVYEFDNITTKDFPLFSSSCTFTDDTIMTLAVARALLRSQTDSAALRPLLVQEMQAMGRDWPGRGYGIRFCQWLYASDPQPYLSFGNGSAMRASPCGLFAVTLEEALSLAEASADVTHNHPEGIKGAQATAAAVYLAKTGQYTKEQIGAYLRSNFYPLDRTVDEIRPGYYFNETCQETVPQALQAFLESTSFEDALRTAISLGGDSDTLAAITCSVAWSYYRARSVDPPQDMAQIQAQADSFLPAAFRQTIQAFASACAARTSASVCPDRPL